MNGILSFKDLLPLLLVSSFLTLGSTGILALLKANNDTLLFVHIGLGLFLSLLVLLSLAINTCIRISQMRKYEYLVGTSYDPFQSQSQPNWAKR